LLDERNVEFDVIEYLDQPLDRAMLIRILDLVNLPPREMVRRDANFAELVTDPAALDDPAAVVDLLLAYPVLMQRPIGILGDQAIVARPAERILELLNV
jgi:arsenate reductase